MIINFKHILNLFYIMKKYNKIALNQLLHTSFEKKFFLHLHFEILFSVADSIYL
jgi:hypothetical protein